MKIKQMTWYHLAISLRALGVFYLIFIGCMLLGMLANAFLPETTVSWGTVGTMSSIFMFVLGVTMFKEPLYFGLANGVSRRTVFFSFLLSSSVLALISGLANALLTPLFSGVAVYDTFHLLYEGFSVHSFPNGVTRFAIEAASALMLQIWGYFLGGAFYRMGKKIRILIGACLPLLITMLPMIFDYLPAAVAASVGDFFRDVGYFLLASPWNLLPVIGAVILPLAVFSWLFIRRAPLRA